MKTVSLLLCACVMAVSISGCTSMSPEERAAYMEKRAALMEPNKKAFEASRPVCDSDADCKVKWEAAQLWVVKNAGYKLQIATDVLLETYGSRDMSIAARVTKEPIGDGKYKLVAQVGCNNPFGCVKNPMDAVLDFNKTVSAISAPE